MKKLLALTLSLLMVFSVMPMTMALAEGETYLTMFDASSATASSQIGSIQSSDKSNTKIVTYAVPTGETDADGNPITEDRQVLRYKRTGAYNGGGVAIKADYRSVIKGAIGIRFWMAGDPATFDSSDKVSLSFQTSSFGYKNATEHQGVWLPTPEGATYEWYWNKSVDMRKSGATTIDVAYNVVGKANELFTDSFLGQVKQIMFGVDAYSAGSLKETYYIDAVELIYPEGVTPSPVEFEATFEGTETAELAEAVAPIKSDAQNNDAVVMPEATLTEGTLAGWALNGDIKKVYAPGATVNITDNATFYAVNANKPALATPATPIADTVNGSTVALKAVTGAVYSKDGATWQTSSTFAGLTPGGTYTFYQKMSETLTHAESAVSEGLTVTTPVEYVYEAENCSPIGYKAGATTAHTLSNTYNTADGGVNYKYVQDNGTNAVGARNEFTVKNLPTGIFTLTTYARNVNTRSKYQVTLVNANGEVVGDFGVADFTSQTYKFPGASYHSANYLENEVTVAEEGTYTLVFTNVKAGSTGMCLDSFTFKKVADYNLTEAKVKIDGEEVAVLEPGATYTIPTPPTGYCYTDGETDYYGGEQVVVEKYLNLTSEVLTTKDVYTMDEGKTIEGGIFHHGAGEYLEVDGDKKLAIKLKSDAYAYLVLPSDWASKPYYKPTKITYTIGKTSTDTSSLAYKTLDLCSKLGDSHLPAGEIHSIVTTSNMAYAPKTININVTEDMYDCNYLTGKLYAGNWTESNPIYLYVDDLTIYYEYDFDYVAPTGYSITIDGEVVEFVEVGSTYTLPALAAGKYYVGGYEAGQEFVVNEDLAFTTATYTYDITIDGTVVDTVEYGTTYTLPALAAGKYYVDVEETTFVVTEDLTFTTATYTYDITIDGVKVATVEYGTEYTLPTLEAGKYYVETEETTFVVTEDLTFTTAKYTFDVTIDGVVVDTVAYGDTFVLPFAPEGKHYKNDYVAGQEFVVTEALAFTTAINKYDITIDGEVVATVKHGAEYTLPTLPVSKYYVDVDATTFVVTGALSFTTATKEVKDTLMIYDATANGKTGAIAMWTNAKPVVYQGRDALQLTKGYTRGAGVSDENMFGSFADYADSAIGVRFWMVAESEELANNVQVYVGAPKNLSDNFNKETLAGETDVIPGTTWTQYTVMFGEKVTAEEIAAMTHIMFVSKDTSVVLYVDDVELLLAEEVDADYDITIDGEVVASAEHNTYYTLPALEAGKYYVETKKSEVLVTEALSFTTATYTYDITIDGEVKATVAYGETYTLPALEAGKYYVDVTETTFVVTEALSFTTATYTYDITIDGEVKATVAYGETYTLPELEAGKYYVDVTETTFVVTEALSFTTATYTYDITVDGEVVATVEYGTEYTLPTLEAGKYYVDVTETTFVVTEALSFTTATYTYDITIDGVKVDTVAYGETFVLPATIEGKQYVGGYVAGQEFVVTEALAFTTEDIPAPEVSVSTKTGAGVRFNEVTGLRFTATIDTAAVAQAEALGYTVTMGTLIAPADRFASYDDLTFEADANNYLDVVTEGYYNEEKGTIAGSISNIKEANWGRDFFARAYVKLVKDGKEVVYYAEAANARSIKSVAQAALNDDSVEYRPEQVALLEKWAAAADWKK